MSFHLLYIFLIFFKFQWCHNYITVKRNIKINIICAYWNQNTHFLGRFIIWIFVFPNFIIPFYPPPEGGGGILAAAVPCVRASVRPSVRPSVRASVSHNRFRTITLKPLVVLTWYYIGVMSRTCRGAFWGFCTLTYFFYKTAG